MQQVNAATLAEFILISYPDKNSWNLSLTIMCIIPPWLWVLWRTKKHPGKTRRPIRLFPTKLYMITIPKMSFAKNFQGKSWREGEYYVLKTNSWYSFTMDMSDDEAEAYASYPSYADYLERIIPEQTNKFFLW